MSKLLDIKANVSHYRILSKIGAGGMGEVYLAEDTKLERKVALKILPPEFARDADRMNRFVREARAASALNHPNIITIHEINEFEGTHFIAAEYITGETLHKLNQKPLELRTALDIAIQVASALDAAHRAGIIHRDLKPENIMVRPDAVVKLLDFGIAKLSQPPALAGALPVDEDAPTALKPPSTNPGMVIGTANYMSPEQAQGKEIDARSVIFSFGIVLYEMLTGKRAFDGQTPVEIISSIMKDEPRPIHQLLPGAPREIERIVSKTLRKDADERYQTARGLLTDLKDAKQELEFQDKLERTLAPNREDPITQPVSAPTGDEPRATTSSVEVITGEIKKHKLGVALASLVVLAMLGIGLWFLFLRASTDDAPMDSIAVLPFTNAGGDRESEFLSDGIAETLINNFTKIPELKVTARSTAFRFRGREGEPREVGRELGVGAVLTGKLLQRGDALSVQVDLINTSNGVQIWGNRYEGRSADIVTIQQRIATDVSSQLKLKLTGSQAEQVARTYTQNPEAYQHYIRGRYHWNKRTADDLKKGLEEFQAAADIDPNYALAYVGLADCYVLLEEYAGVPASETLPKAEAFAQKALQIDDSIGEAHATLGLVNCYMWRWAEAEAELKQAIELNPNYPTAHHWYNVVLNQTSRYDEAMAAIKRAQKLDPLSGIIGVNVGTIYMARNDPQSAATEFKRIVEFDPSWWGGHFYLGTAYLKLNRYEEALAALQKSVEMTNRNGRAIAFLGYAYGVMGRRSEAQAIIKELESKYTKREAVGQHLAAVYAGLGDREQAFDWLEKDLKASSGDLVRIKWYPPFDSLRDDPRFKELLKRMNLPF